MREDTIRKFLLGEIPSSLLADEALRSVKQLDEIRSEIAIWDMDQDFDLKREHLIALCDSGITAEFNPEALTPIAFAILASDRFVWEDDIMSEVLNDWSCPEVNLPLVSETLRMHRNWLTREETPPDRPPLPPRPRGGILVSLRRKVASQE